MRLLALACWTAMILLLGSPAFCVTSGLLIIPTVDTVGADNYWLDFEIDSSLTDSEATETFMESEFGFGDRVEAGVDFSTSADTKVQLFPNVKYVAPLDHKRRNVVGVGVANFAGLNVSTPFATYMHSLGRVRLHLGALQGAGSTQLFTGIDNGFDHPLTLMADFTSGAENYSSVAANYQFNHNLGLLAGVEFPNGGGGSFLTVFLGWGGKYRSREAR